MVVTLRPLGSSEQNQDSENSTWLVLSVADTGVGIDADRQAAIFEPFNQADGTTSRNYGGTGLGLSITRQLTELMGGRLELVSEPGRGSTFSVIFPVQEASLTQLDSGRSVTPAVTDLKDRDLVNTSGFGRKALLHPEEDSVVDPGALQGLRVLVAENDMRNLYTLSGLLENAGASTHTVTNMAEVLDTLRQGDHFDLILSGLLEDPHDDEQDVQRLEEAIKETGVPLMCLSRAPSKEQCHGCVGCLAKVALQRPFLQSDLVTSVASFLPVSLS